MRARALWAVMAAWALVGLAVAPPMPHHRGVPVQSLLRGTSPSTPTRCAGTSGSPTPRPTGIAPTAKLEIDVDNGIDPDFRSTTPAPGHHGGLLGPDAYAGTGEPESSSAANDGVCQQVH